MADREKVIKGLECCDHIDCASCPYYDTALGGGCDMYADALALLKEQEAVVPVKEHEVVMNTLACGACHTLVARWGNTRKGDRVYLFKAKYCPSCGRKVRWNGWDE